MHPLVAFGALTVNRRFFKDVAEADRAAGTLVSSHPYDAMTTADGPGLTEAAMKRVSPEAGLYADPGGQAGIRYWDGREWSPLLPADLASGRQAPKFLGQALPSPPDPGGCRLYAASQARRLTVRFKVLVAAAILTLPVVAVILSWLTYSGASIPVLLAFMAFRIWKVREAFVRHEQAARAAPLA